MKNLIYFKGCMNLQEVKSRYKFLALLHHPDRENGNTAIFQDINNEYQYICEKQIFDSAEKSNNYEDCKQFADILQKIVILNGVNIEICGDFIWCTGQTWLYSDIFKQSGFKFAGAKKAWYYSPDWYRKKSAKVLTFDRIRELYGSIAVETKPINNYLT